MMNKIHHNTAIRRIGKNMGLMAAQMNTLSRVIEQIDFGAVLSMQKQMEVEAIAEITDDMVESVMEKAMMSYDAAKALLVSARLDDLWKEDNEGE
jgi:hypothetical protein